MTATATSTATSSSFDRFTALSFDCYGTLIDWESGIANALEPWADSHGADASRERLVELFAIHESAVQSEHPTMLYPDVLGATLQRISAFLDAPATDEECVAFGASVPDWPAFPDSHDALRRLKERYRLIILSNVDRASFRGSNNRLGVEFDLVVTAQDVGAYKPSARSFPAMFDQLGTIAVDRSSLLHVAQSLFHDHEPAAQVHLPSVWIDRRFDRAGFGATPAPRRGLVEPKWRYRSMAEFADAALS
jgi:2-haloacid dehalogenase